jgi:hypothetical protein
MELQWGIKAISIDYFQLINPKKFANENDIDLIENIRNSKIDFGFEIANQSGIIPSHNLFQFKTIINFLGTVKGTGNAINLGSIEVTYDFFIEKLSDIEKTNNGGLPEALLLTFVTTSFSTTRGILLAKTAGTFIGQQIIPFLPMEDLRANCSEINNKLTANYSKKN